VDLGTALLNTFVVLAVGAALTYVTHDRFKALRGEMDDLRTDFRDLRTDFRDLRTDFRDLRTDFADLRAGLEGEMAATRADLRGDIARLESRLDSGLDSLRSDLTQVALAVGAKGRTAQA
jgi:predicted  nucleic acid-binding Zn-ribbon protein